MLMLYNTQFEVKYANDKLSHISFNIQETTVEALLLVTLYISLNKIRWVVTLNFKIISS